MTKKIYTKDLNECIKEAKELLNKRYTTNEVAMKALEMWANSATLVNE